MSPSWPLRDALAPSDILGRPGDSEARTLRSLSDTSGAGPSVAPPLPAIVSGLHSLVADLRRQLAQRDDLLETVLAHVPDQVYLTDGDGEWLAAGPAAVGALRVTGHTPSNDDSAVSAIEASARFVEAVWRDGHLLRCEETVHDAVRGPRVHEVTCVPRFDASGGRQHMLVMRRDVTALRSADARLQLAGRVLDQSTDGILVADAEHRVVMVNAAFCAITGHTQAEALAQDPMALTAGQQDEALNRAIWELLESQDQWSGEVWNRRSDGQVFPQRLSLSVLRAEGSGAITHYIAALSDLSSSKAAEERIATLSTLDPVTGLANRHQVSLHTSTELARARSQDEQAAVMVVDVDNFKVLNDSLGHGAGDQLLRTVGDRLRLAAGPHAVVGRLGGDEFLVMLPGLRHTAEAAHGARNLMRAVSEPVVLAGMPINVSISIGIALFPADGEDFDTLFGRADSALHAAKRGGRGDYEFAMAAMTEASLERLRLESALRHALATDGLRLEYQPLVELASRRIVGVEALCRWDDPQHGTVPPNVFIPLAEESGMIETLGGWVLRTAARQLRALHDAGHGHLIMAVNLSARQFQRGVVLEQVENALVESGIPPGHLELELTESVLLHDGEAVTSTLRQLQALGVKLSIDDFGTGYSSFAYLRRFKFDKIKIDQSFVRDLIDDPDNAAIVRGIISLARSLGLDVLAEGVETEPIAQRLRHLHCTYAQGYHFARPLRPEVLLARLAS
ncbi:EAL domain-containing protein [uncultured Xylophilus sp.]|uniref:putative bifunctional diguanylate cyclase/phosphodiesterase n=1 Tax=uncultured Xylophilus sp. TaxID=296832 RepID=UPI0025FF8210|nr:EAL domain-containing protein [uncultured Xylophilus sp.]